MIVLLATLAILSRPYIPDLAATSVAALCTCSFTIILNFVREGLEEPTYNLIRIDVIRQIDVSR